MSGLMINNLLAINTEESLKYLSQRNYQTWNQSSMNPKSDKEQSEGAIANRHIGIANNAWPLDLSTYDKTASELLQPRHLPREIQRIPPAYVSPDSPFKTLPKRSTARSTVIASHSR
jgi:hypothetical protein